MLRHKIRHSALAIHARFSKVTNLLLQDEASSGKVLLFAVAIALILMNSPWRGTFGDFWLQHFTITLGDWSISETFRHWVDEGLMAIFFLVVGLEVKREFVRGELRTWRAASLPLAAAVGGMLIPITVYMSLNAGHGGFQGWGIPMTTDTAFAIGILALLGSKLPSSLRAFLLTIMVIDDIGALTVIAVFYTEHISAVPLLIGAGIIGLILLLQWLRLLSLSVFVALGIGLWLAVHASGIHASLAGALLGLAAPIVSRDRNLTRRAIAVRLERALIPISTFVIVPLFALANAGIAFSLSAMEQADAAFVGMGIVLGLVAGKFLGIFGACWLMVRFKVSQLPEHIHWPHIAGIGFVAGIGFTLSIFIAELSFGDSEFIGAAKLSIFLASAISALAGLLILWRTSHKYPAPPA